jgi:hypothetical protein
MDSFQYGDIVDITIRGVRLVERPVITNAPVGYTILDQHGCRYTVPLGAEITRTAPAEWPPQRGDLWRDEKHHGLWYACSEGDDDHVTLLGPRQESAAIGDLARWGAIFVHREQQDGGVPC